MKINPQSFFNFCAGHAALLRGLAEHDGEIAEAEGFRLIRAHPSPGEELPETVWRRLRELQILLPTEPGGEFHLLAEPVARLLSYLFNDAKPATPELIRGYVLSLENTSHRLGRALAEEDVAQVRLAFEETAQTLRRIHADLEETQQAILAEVARFKTERARVSVREKYRRIVYWMERYVEPMIEIVRADGPLRAALDETARRLRQAGEETLFTDHPALVRNLRFLRLLAAHALRVFLQCRKEIQPLYESLRRSSFIAEGAARALEQLQTEGLSRWPAECRIGVATLRFQNVPGDEAIALALRRVIEHPPEPAPVLQFSAEPSDPDALRRLAWLESLPEAARAGLPIKDLLGWLLREHPDTAMPEALTALSRLIFHRDFHAVFTEEAARVYPLRDAQLESAPVRLSAHE